MPRLVTLDPRRDQRRGAGHGPAGDLHPAAALVVRGQLETVFVVEKQNALLRIVRTGKRTNTEVELLSGVVAGESVVIEGAEQLRDAQPVTLKP